MTRLFTIWMVGLSITVPAAPALGEATSSGGLERAQIHGKQPPMPKIRRTHYPAAGPHIGHADPRREEYDIWVENCHSSSNRFCLSDPSKTSTRGVLACRLRSLESLGGHTANWEILDNRTTCFYNYGEKCCFDGTESPPNISSGMGRACARWACGRQFCDATTCLDPGVLVEEPTIQYCVGQTAQSNETLPSEAVRELPDDVPRCNSCCEDRADFWSGELHGYDKQNNFYNGCKTACRNAFGPTPARGALGEKEPAYESWAGVKAGRTCKAGDADQRKSRRSPTDQCKSCCMDSVTSKRIPSDAVTSCMRECSK